MRYFAPACHYNGTIARSGVVDGKCLETLARVKASGRKLIWVTGRALDEILHLLFRAHVPASDRHRHRRR